jgi:hypothetical protein
MKLKELVGCVLFLGLGVVLTSSVSARAGEGNDDCKKNSEHHDHDAKTPVGLVGVIPVPGNPITSADIAWVDPGTERYYFADRSNFGVDIIDAENDVWVGRVAGMAGPLTSGGGTATTNGPGPNGVLVTPNRKLWAGDGNSTVQVADVDPDSSNYLKIIGSASTAIPACDDGTHHYCGRADELGYDPKDRIILVANNAPLSVAAPHAGIDPYATFISAVPPYPVLRHIVFAGSVGLEQPLWDPEIHRFFLTVPGNATTGKLPSVAVINATSMQVEKSYSLNCQALTGTPGFGTTGIALGAFQHLLVSACGAPIILNALNGHVIDVIKQVGGGDEVWYNSGDGRFYVTGADKTSTAMPQPQSLGVIDAETSHWLQNVKALRAKNPAAFAETNHIYTIVQINAAIAAAPATDDSVCKDFGFRGTGCVAVFTHSDRDDE